MVHHRRNDDGLLGVVKYWPLVAAVGMGLIFYGVVSTKVATHEILNRDQSQKLDGHETRISRMEQAVLEIPQMREDTKKILQLLGGRRHDR